jgi:hypothetical protein
VVPPSRLTLASSLRETAEFHRRLKCAEIILSQSGARSYGDDAVVGVLGYQGDLAISKVGENAILKILDAAKVQPRG